MTNKNVMPDLDELSQKIGRECLLVTATGFDEPIKTTFNEWRCSKIINDAFTKRADTLPSREDIDKALVKRTERGWAGHYICSDKCTFKRNTLLEFGKHKIVVSTVGNMLSENGKRETIGLYRYYETMAFEACRIGSYWEADIDRQVDFESEWVISELKEETDQDANDMHETVVDEITKTLTAMKGGK